MRKTIPFFLTITILSLFCSCANTKQVAVERKTALQNSREQIPACFVQMSDGTVKNYSSLKLITSIYKSPHLLADGKIKIYPNEILSYQNNNHFAINAGGFSLGGHKSNIASETLPGFAVRIAAGRLNVYIKKYKVNERVIDEYFLQEGDGQVLAYTPELMDALIKNSPEALDFFNNNRKHIKLTRQLKLTASIFNDAYFNKEKQTETKSDELAFTGKRKSKKRI